MSREVRWLLWVQSRRTPAANRFWIAVTALGYGSALPLLACAALAWVPRYRAVGWTAAGAVGLVEALFNRLCKSLVRRERPFNVYPELIPVGRIPRDKSFPSGHTCGAFACAFVFAWGLPPWAGAAALLAAGLIGFSRVYLGVHYPTDVLGGVLAAAVTDGVVLWVWKMVG